MARIYLGGKADRRADRSSAENAKKIILAGIRSGHPIVRACEAAGRSRSTYDYYRRTDPDWRALVDAALSTVRERVELARESIPDFPEFSEKYLGRPALPSPPSVVRPS